MWMKADSARTAQMHTVENSIEQASEIVTFIPEEF